MAVPLQSDVTALAQKILAPVRAKFFYGSSVEERATVIPLTEGYGNEVNLPTVSDFFVDSIPDGVRMDQMQTITASNLQITTGLVGGQFVINKAADRNSRDKHMGLISQRILGELKKRRAQDILSLASSWSATTIGGAATTLTWGHLFAADGVLVNHDSRAAAQESRRTIAVHGKSLYPVLRNLAGITAATGAFSAATPDGPSADIVRGKRVNLGQPKAALNVNGTQVFIENFIRISSGDMVGMAFFEDGIIYVPAVDIEEVIHEKVVGFYGHVVDIWARYGYGIGPFQADGVSITAAAAVPTS